MDPESEEYKIKMASVSYCDAQTEYSLKNYEESLALYNKALQLNPNLCDAMYGKALVYSNLDNNDEAIKILTEYLTKRCDDNGALHRRGVCFYKKGDYINSLNDFNKILNKGDFIPAYQYNMLNY